MATETWVVFHHKRGGGLCVVDDGTSPTLTVFDGNGSPCAEVARAATVHDAIATKYPGATVHRASLGQGEYHARIWRPCHTVTPDATEQRAAWQSSVRAVRIILRRLESVFNVLEPSEANKGSYGHELRHLLILACTEVESSWKAVLKANAYKGGRYWNRSDYHRLRNPLRLADLKASITHAPAWKMIEPFAGWTQPDDLEWYNAYNAVKHDRESSLSQATLKHVIDATAAAYLMVWAQFGRFSGTADRPFTDTHEDEATDLFWVSGKANWDPWESYLPPQRGTGGHRWTRVDCAFGKGSQGAGAKAKRRSGKRRT